ncbi:hypothetical protein OEV98_10915 [Caldibacillus lycopersici]|uniref:Uncharacterized protein n=1 Tax=Perspicuibacillus lycopersici TaxID=1325689 RepID=A0AAE3IXY8_9BACI|nr:hypothetical protein [Perspicuibacillus lycopersici]MCU9614070.1 hypothetical protein [Perspicuibacillus lycopersici]
MNIQITNVNMRYAEGALESVQVFFNGQDQERTISISGYVPLAAEEYVGNESVTALTGLIKQSVSERLLETPAEV